MGLERYYPESTMFMWVFYTHVCPFKVDLLTQAVFHCQSAFLFPSVDTPQMTVKNKLLYTINMIKMFFWIYKCGDSRMQ